MSLVLFFRSGLSYLYWPSAGDFCACHFYQWGKIIHSLAALAETWTWSSVCGSGQRVSAEDFFIVFMHCFFFKLKVVSTHGTTSQTIVPWSYFEQTTKQLIDDALTGAVFSQYRPRFTNRRGVNIGKYCQFIIIFKKYRRYINTYIHTSNFGGLSHAPYPPPPKKNPASAYWLR